MVINFDCVGYNRKVVKVIAKRCRNINICQIPMSFGNSSENPPTKTKVVTTTIFPKVEVTPNERYKTMAGES